MTKRYIGGIISANMLNVSATGASGIWSPSMAAGYRAGFKWPGTLVSVEYFAVGGGGGATGGVNSVNYGSGAASGIVRTGTSNFVPGVTYTITIGSGGAGNATLGGNGQSSSIIGTGITTITATGGTGAGNGFGGSNNDDYTGASTGVGQYNAGGGAGAAGNASNSNGGAAASSTWTGSTLYYGGGGAGGGSGTPGTGGGGYGSSGTTNTGSGAGGGGSGGPYGSGGSGVILIREPDTRTLATTTGSPVVTTSGGYRIYKFNASGTITL
jgi:hypothetical protein